jgi:arylsulfatase A-like enzyme
VLTPEEIGSEIAAYDGAISYVDHHLKELVDKVTTEGSNRPLIVIITSDHGEEFYEHGSFLHGHNLNREVIQVPLVFWGPGHFPPATRISRPVSNVAVPSTILRAIAKEDASFSRAPLQALWMGAQDWPFPVSELQHRPWAPESAPVRYGNLRSIVSSLWHYIEHDAMSSQLYNWHTDPREAENLANQPDSAEVIEELRSHFVTDKTAASATGRGE